MKISSFAVVAVLAAAGCIATGPKYPFLNSFCQARATAECSNAVVLACAVAVSTCVTNRQAVCVTSAPPNTVYNPDAAEGCVDEVASAYADAKLTLLESQAIDAACLPVFNGPGVTGAACQVDTDCQVGSMLRCVLAPNSNQGTCQVPEMVMGGGSCSAPAEQCIAGYHCGLTANCDIDQAAGETCAASTPCAPGLACGASGTCVSKSPDGSQCTTDDDCANGICNGAGVAGATPLCVSEITLATMEPFCVASRQGP
jgi:hypothetical protein